MKIVTTLEVESRPGRKVGNTVRQADFAIDKLFQGEQVYVEDHCYKDNPDLRGSSSTKQFSQHLLDKIMYRLNFEYKLNRQKISLKQSGPIFTMKLKLK